MPTMPEADRRKVFQVRLPASVWPSPANADSRPGARIRAGAHRPAGDRGHRLHGQPASAGRTGRLCAPSGATCSTCRAGRRRGPGGPSPRRKLRPCGPFGSPDPGQPRADPMTIPAIPSPPQPTALTPVTAQNAQFGVGPPAWPVTEAPRITADLARRSRPAAVTIGNRSSGMQATLSLPNRCGLIAMPVAWTVACRLSLLGGGGSSSVATGRGGAKASACLTGQVIWRSDPVRLPVRPVRRGW